MQATSYINTTLLTRGTENCPVFLGALVICLCFKHSKDNVNDYITKKLSLSMNEKMEILRHLFGRPDGYGVIDSDNAEEFNLSISSFYDTLISTYGEQAVSYTHLTLPTKA